MSLRVVSPGTCSLIVDAGRPRTRHLGVPVGGPADAASMALGNALVGNPPDAAAVEIALTGPTLVADFEIGMVVFGAPFRLQVDDHDVEAGKTFTLPAGAELRIGGTPRGCRAYVCAVGGFRATKVLDSITSLEPMRAGDMLSCDASHLPARGLALPTDDDPILRCLPGPQADWFDGTFFETTYRVLPASDRMGLRLDGPPMRMPGRELASEAVAPGAVQVTNDGRPIVLGVDGQTIGGYAKIAHVIAADLDRLGRLRPGDEVRFRSVTEAEAEAASTARRDALSRMLRRIAVAGAS